jgi:uncharacterized protein (TIGR02118 family)
MIKLTILLRRRADFTHELFVEYYLNHHAPMFSSLPEVRQHVRRYVLSAGISDSLPGVSPVTFDAITDLWFDDPSGIGGVFGSERCMREVQSDGEKFLDFARCEFLVSNERVVIG